MDSPLDKALKRRAELVKEVEEIDHFVAYYHRFSDTKEERLVTIEESGIRPERTLPAPRRKRKKATPSDIGNLSAELIRAAKRPLSRSELVAGLEDRGLVIESKDKPRYVGTILWRLKQRFENLEGHGYWLKGEEYSPAGYPAPKIASATRVDDEIERNIEALIAEAASIAPKRP